MAAALPTPVRARIERVVLAIVEAEVAEELGVESLDGVPFVEETAQILGRRLFGMQRYLAGGLSAMTLVFDASTVATQGGRFHTLPLADRRKALARVRAVPLGLVNNFAAFYDKLGGFTFWSLLEEHGRLDVGLGTDAPGSQA
jgi:hypothetical protein